MPLFTWADAYQSTLSATLTAGATTMAAPTSTTGAPAADPTAVPAVQFRLTIQSAGYPGSGTRETVTVTDSRTGTWTITAPANSYSSGDTVANTLGSGGLLSFAQLLQLPGSYQSQRWYGWALGANEGSGSLIASADGVAYFTPLYVGGVARQWDAVGTNIATVGGTGSVVRLGLYADNNAGYPGALFQDFGTVSGTSTGDKTVTLGSTITLKPGLYWRCVASQGAAATQPTIRSSQNAASPWIGATGPVHSAFAGISATGYTGALPSTFSNTGLAYVGTGSGGCPTMFLRAL